MQYYTPKTIGAWGCLYIEEKLYLVSHCHVKKIAVKRVIFSTNIFIIFLLGLVFFIQKTTKINEDSYFSVFLRLNVAKYVLKKLQS